MNVRVIGILPALILLFSLHGSAAWGQFVSIEDFETLAPGAIGGQAGWTAPASSSTVAADPAEPDNQVLSVVTESTYLYRELTVAGDATRMLFFRFRIENQASLSFGLSDVLHPDRFDHFEAELSVTNSPTELRVNDDGTYDVIAAIQEGIWYNCWMLIDNANDDVQVWLHSRPDGDATAADQLSFEGQTAFLFRNGTAGDLVTFYIKTGGGSGVDGPLLIDDIHLESTDAENLTNPRGSSPVPVRLTTWGRVKRGF